MIVTVAGRQLVIHDREEWQNPAHPVTGPKPSPDLVHHFVVHWPGAGPDWKPDTDVAAHLRWAQDMYLLDPARGYSYGYGFVIGPNPIDWDTDPIVTDIWEVRGFDIRIASNDGDIGVYGQMANPNFNGRSISAQIMASEHHPATADQIEQCRYLVALTDEMYGETLTVIPHRESDATTCPGDLITAHIADIAERPSEEEPVQPVPTATEIADAVYARLMDPVNTDPTTAEAIWRYPITVKNENDVEKTANIFSIIGWSYQLLVRIVKKLEA